MYQSAVPHLCAFFLAQGRDELSLEICAMAIDGIVDAATLPTAFTSCGKAR